MLVFLCSCLKVTSQLWNGATDSDWGNASNWNGGAVPGNSGVVVIPAAAPNQPVLDESRTLASLTLNSGSSLHMNGFRIRTTGIVSIVGAIVSTTAGDTIFFETGGGTSILRSSVFENKVNIKVTGTGGLSEADNAIGGNTFKDDLVVVFASSGVLTLSASSRSRYQGNLSLERTAEGTTSVFTSNVLIPTTVAGDFTYKNHFGGNTTIGATSSKTIVAGKVNLDILGKGMNRNLTLRRLDNSGGPGGGIVSITHPGTIDILNDTLKLEQFTVLGKNGSTSDLTNNQITGAFTFSDSTENEGALYSYGNIFDGTAVFHFKGQSNSPFYESATAGNIYKGNVSIINEGDAQMRLADGGVPDFHQDLKLQISPNFLISNAFRFVGANNAVFEELNAQLMPLKELIIEKEEDAKLTFNSPVEIENAVNFVTGYIETDIVNYINFASNTASYLGGSDQSHVMGVVRKTGNGAFTFPVGNGSTYHPISISAPGGGGHVFSAVYLSPDFENYDPGGLQAPLQKVSAHGYWDLKRLIGTGDVSVKLAYQAATGLVTAPEDLRVAHWDGIWKSLGGIVVGDNDGGTIETEELVSVFSLFAVATTNFEDNPLPVTLTAFSVSYEGGVGMLRWGTSSEVKSSHFEIELSKNAVSWDLIGRVSAKGGPHSPASYHYNHSTLPAEIQYYRLKMVDKDGSFAYSGIRSLQGSAVSGSALTIFPNPAQHLIQISTDSFAEIEDIEVVNMAGKKQKMFVSGNGRDLDISGLVPGIYFLKAELSNHMILTRRFVVGKP